MREMSGPKTFFNPWQPIKEGAVEIRFDESDGKVRVTYTVDFAQTDLSPSAAANVQKAIVTVLRKGLGVSLAKLK